jgi:hypothetical protein
MRATRVPVLAWILLATFSLATRGAAEETPSPEAGPVPGELTVIQMTAVELESKLPADPEPESFQWRIVEGERGKLIGADRPTAVFLAPSVEHGVVTFLVELTVTYADQPPSTRRVRIRVLSDPSADTADPDDGDTEWLQEIYRSAREAEERRRNNAPSLVVPGGSQPRVNIGVGVGPGGWHGGVGFSFSLSYPISQPVPVPSPGQTRVPGEGAWASPRPVPYDEVATTFPASVAESYLPQDYPLNDGPALGDLSPTPVTARRTLNLRPAAEPLVDPGFAADPFGW